MPINQQPTPKKISDMHREVHRAVLALAKEVRSNGGAHALLMEQARTARFYFAQMRAIGE